MPRTYIPRSDRAYQPPAKPTKRPKKTPKIPDTSPKTSFVWRVVSFFGILLLGGIVLGGPFALSRWDYLDIASVEVVGIDRLDEDRIQRLVEGELDAQISRWWNSRNIFLMPQKKIETRILESESSVSNVQVLRRFPHTAVILLQERYPLFELCSPEECHLLANDGIAIAHNGTSSFIPIRRNVSSEIGTQVFSPRTVEWLNNLVKMYAVDLSISIEAIEVVLEGESGILEVAIIAKDGYRIRFDFETNIIVQKNALRVVFESDIPQERRKELEYIDLRVPNRVYYRFNGALEQSNTQPDGEEETPSVPNQ